MSKEIPAFYHKMDHKGCSSRVFFKQICQKSSTAKFILKKERWEKRKRWKLCSVPGGCITECSELWVSVQPGDSQVLGKEDGGARWKQDIKNAPQKAVPYLFWQHSKQIFKECEPVQIQSELDTNLLKAEVEIIMWKLGGSAEVPAWNRNCTTEITIGVITPTFKLSK